MQTIQIDFDVFKAITARRSTEAMTENDVLRELLGLPRTYEDTCSQGLKASPDWVVKGVSFPDGTEFRATHKGQRYTASVEGGTLRMGEQTFGSPSAAACAVTETSVNGWKFWEARIPGTPSWQNLAEIRRKSLGNRSSSSH